MQIDCGINLKHPSLNLKNVDQYHLALGHPSPCIVQGRCNWYGYGHGRITFCHKLIPYRNSLKDHDY